MAKLAPTSLMGAPAKSAVPKGPPKAIPKNIGMSMTDKVRDTADAKAAAPKPRQAYGIGALGSDEQHLKQSVHFQQTPPPARNPAQKLSAPKKDDGLKKTAQSMSKRFIGGT